MSTYSNLKSTYLNFWKSKGAAEIPGISLIPQGDSTLLFVNSGMFPLVPYLLGQTHPLGTRLCNVQRCIRTEDLEDMGDTRHLTLFNMMGNWSLGDYFKKEQIPWVLDLYVNHFKLDINKIYVSVFEGDDSATRDDESIELWKTEFRKYGVEAEYSPDPFTVSETLDGKAQYRIFSYPKKKNWWCRGEVAGEPGGPDTEIFYDFGQEAEEYNEKLHINGDNGRFVEIGNNVFMQYKFDGTTWKEMEKKNVDFGGGLDRMVMPVEGKNDIFQTTLYWKVIEYLVDVSKKNYDEYKKEYRIIADHIKASIFLLADGVFPSNKDQGYILRRLIRRMIVQSYNLGIRTNFINDIAKIMIDLNKEEEHILQNQSKIIDELIKEEAKFRQTLDNGMREFEKLDKNNINGEVLFNLYETFGFPIEQSIELLKQNMVDIDFQVLQIEFNKAKKEHSDLSRNNSEQKFKGGLADNSDIVTALHTTHHLVLAAIKKVLNDKSIHQKGSNINAERLRIDFNFERKLTMEELKEIELLVQSWIDKDYSVIRTELPINQATKLGAEQEFGAKYPEIVSVYIICHPEIAIKLKSLDDDFEILNNIINDKDKVISIEFCGGPHISTLSEISKYGKFKIIKEEASSAGVRRVKATLM